MCNLCTQGGVTLGFVIAAMQQIATGIRHLHSLGILHRDLRAANVLLASLEPLQVRVNQTQKQCTCVLHGEGVIVGGVLVLFFDCGGRSLSLGAC